ncbi:traB domain-containing protein [Trichonephila inaurata madagascariensis]|uniref:TraB domain-containing protein n=1 Tax=Trichonephila inaurata madagascariensis TaxID=2747483 RepID=A0A8X6MFZ4_9ARAC|nr:traB domain-containing protein [Trichonephila inaurata madagascariensis]
MTSQSNAGKNIQRIKAPDFGSNGFKIFPKKTSAQKLRIPSSQRSYVTTTYNMESNVGKSSQSATPNHTTYAEVLNKGKVSSDDASNNNPVSNHAISNGNEQLPDSVNSANNQGGAIFEDSKNSNLTSTSSSLNDSFEDAEDSQLDFNSSSSKERISDIKISEEVEESTVSGETTNISGSNSGALEMNESNSSGEDSGEESDFEDDRNNLDTLYPTALKWKFRPSNPPLNLPETVTILENEFGSKVFLVGTAHFSLESQEDVAKTIRAVQPDSVMIELCKSRVNMLEIDEATILEEAKGLSFQKLLQHLNRMGSCKVCCIFFF